jgi:hypothetical protein
MSKRNLIMVVVAFCASCGPIPSALAGTYSLRSGSNSGSLSSSDGTSATRSGKYADVWTFTLTAQRTVTISMTSSFDNYLILYTGSSRNSSTKVTDNDDTNGNNAQITRTLGAGTYSIEATSYSSGTTGSYTLNANLGSSTTTSYTIETARFAGSANNSYFFLRIRTTGSYGSTTTNLRFTMDFSGQNVKGMTSADNVGPATFETFLLDAVGFTPVGFVVDILDLMDDAGSVVESRGMSSIELEFLASNGGGEFFIWTQGSQTLARPTLTVEAFDRYGRSQGIVGGPVAIELRTGEYAN